MSAPVSLPQIPPKPSPDIEPKSRYWMRAVWETIRDIISKLGSLTASLAAKAETATTEIDFGSTPVYEATFTVTDANITTSMYIIPRLMYSAPTSKDLDELEFDDFDFMAVSGTGEFTLYARSKYGPVADKFKVVYTYGV